MLSGVVRAVRRVLDAWSQPRPLVPLHEQASVESHVDYKPLEHVVLTDGVSRTLFEEYAEHRHSERHMVAHDRSRAIAAHCNDGP